MIKVEVIEEFTLGRFNELKNIQRKSKEEKGRLFVGDIFECKEDMVEYLTKTNKLGKAFIKVIEVIPEKIKEVEKKEEKPIAKINTTKKTTSSKKTIVKKK